MSSRFFPELLGGSAVNVIQFVCLLLVEKAMLGIVV